MADTGWKDPASGATVNRIGGYATEWVNPTNVDDEDGTYSSYAIANFDGFTRWIRAYNFSCGVPAGAEVTGIAVRIKRYCDAAFDTVSDSSLKIGLGTTPEGTDKASASEWPTSNA